MKIALCFTVSALDCRPLIPELVCAWREAGSRFTPLRLDKLLPQRRLLTARGACWGPSALLRGSDAMCLPQGSLVRCLLGLLARALLPDLLSSRGSPFVPLSKSASQVSFVLCNSSVLFHPLEHSVT